MPGVGVLIRVAVSTHTRESLASELAEIIEEHRDRRWREGVVPALLAEEIVDRMVGRSILLLDEEL